MKEAFFLAVAGLLIATGQVTSFAFAAPAIYKPDLMVVMVVWVSVRMSFTAGIIFSFAAGMLMDLLSGSPTGLYAVLYTMIFVLCGYLNATFHVDGPLGRSALSAAAVIFVGVVALLTRRSAGPFEVGPNIVGSIVLKAACTGAAGALLFPLVDRSWGGYLRLLGAR